MASLKHKDEIPLTDHAFVYFPVMFPGAHTGAPLRVQRTAIGVPTVYFSQSESNSPFVVWYFLYRIVRLLV